MLHLVLKGQNMHSLRRIRYREKEPLCEDIFGALHYRSRILKNFELFPRGSTCITHDTYFGAQKYRNDLLGAIWNARDWSRETLPHAIPCGRILQLLLPRKPVAYNSGLLSMNYRLLWDIVAYFFRLLGVPGGFSSRVRIASSYRPGLHLPGISAP